MDDEYNPFTGNKRKKARRDPPRKKRHSLSHAPESKWLAKQAMMSFELYVAAAQLNIAFLMLFLALDIDISEDDKNALCLLMGVHANCFCGVAVEMLKLDAASMDCAEEDIQQAGHRKELAGVNLDACENDDHCQQQTRFTKQQMRAIADSLPLGNKVCVCHNPPKHCKFDAMEPLLHVLRRMSTGRTHKDLADNEFGGCPRRWGQGYNHLVVLMDRHFQPLMGPNGLAVWADHFPDCAESIREFITRPREKKDRDGGTVEVWQHRCHVEPGSFNAFGFTDCTVCEMCRPGSGPANSQAGAPRKDNWCPRQRAFYDGCDRGMEACLKILTVSLPNGLTAACCGPCSGRDNDIAMFRLSEFDEFLLHLNMQHHGGNRMHCVCGDAIFAGCWTCLRTAHHAPPGCELTEEQESLNENVKSARESVEWTYSRSESMFPPLTDEHHLKLEVDSGRVFAEARVMCLLSNFNICCCEGSTMAGERGLRMAPPAPEQCLDVNPNDFAE